jgi:hypothetical protein
MRKAIAGSLAGEIEGVILAVERRNYLRALDTILQEQRETQQTAQRVAGQRPPLVQPIQIRLPAFGVRITFNYFAVFDKTCDRIGLLGDIAGEVALLYTLSKGIVEDMNSLREGVQFSSVDEVVEFHQGLRDLLVEQLNRGRRVIERLRGVEREKFRWPFR